MKERKKKLKSTERDSNPQPLDHQLLSGQYWIQLIVQDQDVKHLEVGFSEMSVDLLGNLFDRNFR